MCVSVCVGGGGDRAVVRSECYSRVALKVSIADGFNKLLRHFDDLLFPNCKHTQPHIHNHTFTTTCTHAQLCYLLRSDNTQCNMYSSSILQTHTLTQAHISASLINGTATEFIISQYSCCSGGKINDH